jgi:hypothetical protein
LVFIPLVAIDTSQGAKKGRGRPAGAPTAVLRGRRWGLPHFAYLRAIEDGIDPGSAWERYLGFRGDEWGAGGGQDAMLNLLCEDAIAMAGRWPRERQNVVHAAVATLRSTARSERPPPLTLEEFIAQEGIDPDFYSEAELMELYQQAIASPTDLKLPATMAEPSAAPSRLEALRVLEPLVATAPNMLDGLGAWLVPRMVRLLGLGTVGDLSRAMMAAGSAWPRAHKGVGLTQAEKLAAWLDTVKPGHVTALRKARAAGRPKKAERPSRPSPTVLELADRAGATVGSLEADAGWCMSYCAAQPALYRNEIERFLLWAWCLHGATIELDTLCVDSYLDWAKRLSEADVAWVNPGAFDRTDPRWRPFRRGLGPRAEHNARAALKRFIGAVRKRRGD